MSKGLQILAPNITVLEGEMVKPAGQSGGVLASDDPLLSSVVSSSRYNAETKKWEPRPSANVVVFSSTDKEAATPGDIQAGDLIVRAS